MHILRKCITVCKISRENGRHTQITNSDYVSGAWGEAVPLESLQTGLLGVSRNSSSDAPGRGVGERPAGSMNLLGGADSLRSLFKGLMGTL